VILTVTLNAALDVTYEIDALVPHGSHRVRSVRERAGGKGVNVASVLACLGVPAMATGLLGGRTGAQITGDLDARALAHAFSSCAGASRQTVNVVSIADGDATIFNEPGPTVTPGEWSAFVEDLAGLISRVGATVVVVELDVVVVGATVVVVVLDVVVEGLVVVVVELDVVVVGATVVVVLEVVVVGATVVVVLEVVVVGATVVVVLEVVVVPPPPVVVVVPPPPVVRMSMHQPPRMSNGAWVVSSTAQRFQVPFGLRPLKVDSVVELEGVGAGASQESTGWASPTSLSSSTGR